MKISEDVVQQRPEGLDLVGKLCQLEKTRHLCEFLTGSVFSPDSSLSQDRSELRVTGLRAASASANQEASAESDSSALFEKDPIRVHNNKDSDSNTCPIVVGVFYQQAH